MLDCIVKTFSSGCLLLAGESDDLRVLNWGPPENTFATASQSIRVRFVANVCNPCNIVLVVQVRFNDLFGSILECNPSLYPLRPGGA